MVYIYDHNYYYIIKLPLKYFNIQFDKKLKLLNIKFINFNNNLLLYFNKLKLIIFSFSLFFFKKLKFKGKGYYMFKNKRNTFNLRLGYSHKLTMYCFNTYSLFLTKTSLIFFSKNKHNMVSNVLKLKNFKKINVFTGRGIRFNKQLIYKKVMKIK